MLENESQRAVLRGRPRALPKTSKSEVEEKISEMKRLVGDDKDFTALFEEAKVQLFFFSPPHRARCPYSMAKTYFV